MIGRQTMKINQRNKTKNMQRFYTPDTQKTKRAFEEKRYV